MNPVIPRLSQFWTARHHQVLPLAIVLMSAAAAVWLSYEFWRLLFQSPPLGAIDLNFRHEETHWWFDGQNVYRRSIDAVYPPATYPLLWPFLGWAGFPATRWVWALTSVAAMFWMAAVFLKESHAETRLEKRLILLCPFAVYATGAAVGNGQLIVHMIPCLTAACLILARGRGGWAEHLAAAGLFLFVLVKPAVAAPFFWIFLFVKGGSRASALVVAAYAGLTLWACSFQEQGPVQLIIDWYGNSTAVLLESAVRYSNGNVHSLLAGLGKSSWIAPVSLSMLAALGVWVFRFRRVDIWILLGVCALVSRLYTYHGWYDDLLILLPTITLFRVAKSAGRSIEDRGVAAILFGACLLFMIAPGGLYVLPEPWKGIYVATQVSIWLAMLAFLAKVAWRTDRKRL